jgi:hypothetical protein
LETQQISKKDQKNQNISRESQGLRMGSTYPQQQDLHSDTRWWVDHHLNQKICDGQGISETEIPTVADLDFPIAFSGPSLNFSTGTVDGKDKYRARLDGVRGRHKRSRILVVIDLTC